MAIDTSQIFSISLLPTCVTLALGLLGVMLTWAKDLGEDARRLRFLDESIKKVQFWDTWLKALNSVDRLSEQEQGSIAAELRQIAYKSRTGFRSRQRIEELSSGEFLVYKNHLNYLRRGLMLYKQPSKAAVSMRFWGCLISLEPIVGVLLSRLPNPASRDFNPHVGVASGVAIFLCGLTFSLALAHNLERIYMAQLRDSEKQLQILALIEKNASQRSVEV